MPSVVNSYMTTTSHQRTGCHLNAGCGRKMGVPVWSLKRRASATWPFCILLQQQQDEEDEVVEVERKNGERMTYWVLLIMSSLALFVGGSLASLLGRLYFVHGGSRRWLYACIQSVGWPILVFPLTLSYSLYSQQPTTFTHLTPKTLSIFAVLGFLTAFDNLLYSWGTSYLPVSTNSLLCSSQLAFSALFSYAVVKKRMRFFIINSLVLILAGSVVLVIHGDSDRPDGTTKKQYIIGCIVTVTASGLYALTLTLLELIYTRVVGKKSFVVVMEVQAMVCVGATLFTLVGMRVSGDLAGMGKESREFNLGRGMYAGTLVGSAIGWQLYVVGGAGIIFLTSSLTSCVFMTAMIPVLPVLALFFFNDAFTADKAISLVFSLWGFSSYIYGSHVTTVDDKHPSNNEDTTPPSPYQRLMCILEYKCAPSCFRFSFPLHDDHDPSACHSFSSSSTMASNPRKPTFCSAYGFSPPIYKALI